MDKPKIIETTLLFGPERSLVAIITRSSQSIDHRNQKPGLVFINAGNNNHSGPNRIYVRLARYLVWQGFISCRFDVSGSGDSLPRTDDLSLRKYAVLDTQSVLDGLMKLTGLKNFILIGICLGAEIAFDTAVQNKNVCGVILINGAFVAGHVFKKIYSNAEHKIRNRYYLSHLFSFPRWIKFITFRSNIWKIIQSKIINLLSYPKKQMKITGSNDSYFQHQKWITLSQRRISLLLIYSAGSVFWDIFRMSGKKNVKKIFNRIAKFNLICLKKIDHTFTLLSSQIKLEKIISDWL